MTSPVEQITVECPQCATPYPASYRASINADLDPELAADEEYVRSVSTATCPDCGETVALPLLIVDGDVWHFGGS